MWPHNQSSGLAKLAFQCYTCNFYFEIREIHPRFSTHHVPLSHVTVPGGSVGEFFDKSWHGFRMFPTLSFCLGWWHPKMAAVVGKLRRKFGVFASIPGYREMHLKSKNVQGSWQASCVHQENVLVTRTWSCIGWTLVSQKSTLAHR